MYRRYRVFILAFFLAAFPLVLHGAKQAWESISNRPEEWLPKSFRETQKLSWFYHQFGGDEILVISWPGCTLDDPRLDRLAEELLKPGAGEGKPAAPLFRRVLTGRQALDQLMGPPLELSRGEALRRLEGWLIGHDHRTSCALALVSRAGVGDRHAAVDWVYTCAESASGMPRDQIRVAGSTADGVAIDRISEESLPLLTGLALGIGFTLAYFCFRSVPLAVMVFITAIFSQQLSVAVLHYAGAEMDSIMLMMPSLVFVLTVSAAVHLVNYYSDAIRAGGLDNAPTRAAGYAVLPCGLAAGTTALGLASLAVSQLVPISRFGRFSAIGVLCGFAVLFLLFPSGLQQWPARRWASRLTGAGARSRPAQHWNVLAELVTRHHLAILVAATIAVIAAGLGATRIRTTVKLHDMFTGDVSVIRDYDWIETRIGPLVPTEVVVRFPKDEDPPMLERMRAVERVRSAVAAMDEVGATISAATFAPPFPLKPSKGVIGTARRGILEGKLRRHRDDFMALQYLQETPSEELWRISARVPAGGEVDYGQFLERLERQLTPILEKLRAEGIPVIGAEAVGGVPLVQKAQRQLLEDLLQSFLVAFALVGLAMIFLLRGIRAGALSMFPNLLPSVMIFGMTGWMGEPVGIGSMMTASVALGIAVDDTLHFVTWFRRGLARGQDRKQAVFYAYGRCGTAMVQTSLICGLGLLVFSFSRFVPTAHFARLMVMLLAAALLGDLVVFPAILVSPLGRAFEPGSSLMVRLFPAIRRRLSRRGDPK